MSNNQIVKIAGIITKRQVNRNQKNSPLPSIHIVGQKKGKIKFVDNIFEYDPKYGRL